MSMRTTFSSLYMWFWIDTNMLLQDCFFVSVVIRSHPELNDKPVAVCHSDNPKGTAEISSANYPGRDYGWFLPKFYFYIFCNILAGELLFTMRLINFYYASGIKAGMFVRDAKSLCPQLVILPYNFEAYEEVNHQLGMQFCCYTCLDKDECRGSLISLLLLPSFMTSISAFLFLLNGGCECQRGNDMTKVVMDGNYKKRTLNLLILLRIKS